MNLHVFAAPLGAIVLLAVVAFFAGSVQADPPDFKTPVCSQPAVTDLKITNDRWPDASSPRQFALDAIRLENAKTDQEKAIALWLWIRRFTMYTNGTAPAERGPNGPKPVLDPVKILNIWGAHWCDGLSRCMELSWRHLGYPAQKFYKSGHTLCDAWWVDDDGVGRYHLFDVSEGWFAFTRDGKRIANAEDLARDASLVYRPAVGPALRTHSLNSLSGWVHATHFPYKQTHKMELQMRAGEQLVHSWRHNSATVFQDNVGRKGDSVPEEHGPFKPDVGVGDFGCPLDLSESGVRAQSFRAPENCRWVRVPGSDTGQQSGQDHFQIVPNDADKPAVLTYRVCTPYIISSLYVHFKGTIKSVEISDDNGRNWRLIESKERKGWIQLAPVTKEGKEISAFGRYDVLIRLTLGANDLLGQLSIHSSVQENLFSLPQLLPGDNKITVNGRMPKSHSLLVTYCWNDLSGEKHEESVLATELPFRFTIRADGDKFGDVLCNALVIQTDPRPENIEAIARQKQGEVPLGKSEPLPTYLVSLGKKEVPPLKKLDEYLATLKTATAKNELSDALAGIRVIAFNDAKVAADGKVYDAVREVAMNNLDRPKLEALQVMYWLDRKRAVGDFLKIVREEEPALKLLEDAKLDPKKVDVIDDDRDPGGVRRGHFFNVVAQVALFLADEKCVEAVPALVKIAAEQAKTRDEPRRALMRALGGIGDKVAVPVLLKYAGNDVDDAEVAVEALGKCGDPAAIPAIRKHLGSDYTPLKRNAIQALGRLGDQESIPQLRTLLADPDEDARGAAAEALAALHDTASLVPLGKAADVEPVAWTKKAMQDAMHRLKEKGS